MSWWKHFAVRDWIILLVISTSLLPLILLAALYCYDMWGK